MILKVKLFWDAVWYNGTDVSEEHYSNPENNDVCGSPQPKGDGSIFLNSFKLILGGPSKTATSSLHHYAGKTANYHAIILSITSIMRLNFKCTFSSLLLAKCLLGDEALRLETLRCVNVLMVRANRISLGR
jgi:hypothetical protein